MTLIPGAVIDPGAHWNAPAGYTSAQILVWHYTVGTDSRALIRNNGLAPVLIRDGIIWQYAPLEAVCYTQCEFNRVAIGYEVESLDGWIAPEETANLGYATTFAAQTLGIPTVFYDGPRLPVGSGYRGVTNHRNLIHNACDMHSDGFDRGVWDAAMAATPAKKRRRSMYSILVHEVLTNTIWQVDTDSATKVHIKTWDEFIAQVKWRDLVNFIAGEKVADTTLHRTDEIVSDVPLWGRLWTEARDVDEFNDVAPGGAPAPGGGATPDQVREIVTADGNLTRSKVAEKRPISGTVG